MHACFCGKKRKYQSVLVYLQSNPQVTLKRGCGPEFRVPTCSSLCILNDLVYPAPVPLILFFINSVPHFLAPNPCQTAIQTLFTVYSQIQIIAHSRSMTSYPEGNPLPYINDSQISFCNPNPCQWRHLGRQHAHFQAWSQYGCT